LAVKRLAVAALGLSLVVAAAAAIDSPFPVTTTVATAEPPSPAPTPPDNIESLRALPYIGGSSSKRGSQAGVVRHSVSETSPGYNLFGNNTDRAYLTDLEGRILHTWRVPSHQGSEVPYSQSGRSLFCRLLPNGDLAVITSGQSADGVSDDAFFLMDWNSRLILSLRTPIPHHDVAVEPGGTYLVPFLSPVLKFGDLVVNFDSIVRIHRDGKQTPVWSSYGRLEELRAIHGSSPLDPVMRGTKKPSDKGAFDYYHLNTVEILPDTPLSARDRRFRKGNLLICLRNVNLVAVLDRDSKKVVWSWGMEVLDHPHMPTMLPNGHVLVFDNGERRDYSRVLEVEPVSKKIVWEYRGDPPHSFTSATRGSAQRLPNGNTLICEATNGRAFEVTRVGKIVWEFLNPVVNGQRRTFYRFERLPPTQVEPLLARFKGGPPP
jgi:hypothetical protein